MKVAVIGAGGMGGGIAQRRVPEARVVKGWNTIFSPVLEDPDFGGEAPSVFLASDDEEAKGSVAKLARDMGFDPRDCGALSASSTLERMLTVLGTIGHGLPLGGWALKVLNREEAS